MTKSRRTAATIVLLWPQVLFAEPASPIEIYRHLTSVAPQCRSPADTDRILVCGRRNADRWRVPFIGYEYGDPRSESVSDERERLLSDAPVPCGIAAILAHCGAVGVSVGSRFDGTALRLRPIAP